MITVTIAENMEEQSYPQIQSKEPLIDFTGISSNPFLSVDLYSFISLLVENRWQVYFILELWELGVFLNWMQKQESD